MVEEWKQNDPDGVRRVQELATPLAGFLNSAEWHAFWEPTKAVILHDDKDGAFAWAEGRIGCKPDFVLKVSLGKLSKKELGDSTPRETWALVDDRGEKLRGETRGEPDDLGIAVFDKKSKKYPRIKRVQSELSDRSEWVSEVAKAIRIAGADSSHGYPTTLSAIEWRIERDNRWRGIKGTPGKDSHGLDKTASLSELPEESEVLEDLHAEEDLDEAYYRAFLAHYASAKNPARLTPGELEVFRLSIQLEHREIAEEIGSTEGSVRKLKHQAVKKVRKHGEITVRDGIDTNARNRGRAKRSA
jgi:hypothetical protein